MKRELTICFAACGYVTIPLIPTVITDFVQALSELSAAFENSEIPFFYTLIRYAIPTIFAAVIAFIAISITAFFLANVVKMTLIAVKLQRKGELKLRLVKWILSVQKSISDIDEMIKNHLKYFIAVAFGAIVYAWIKDLGAQNAAFICALVFGFLAYIIANEGIAKYFNTVRGFLVLLFPFSIFVAAMFYEKAFFINAEYRFMTSLFAYVGMWTIFSLVAKYEVADVVNTVIGLAVVFIFTFSTFMTSLFDQTQIQSFFEHLADLCNAPKIPDYVQSINKFAAYTLFFLGCHSFIIALLKIKKYLLKANNLTENI